MTYVSQGKPARRSKTILVGIITVAIAGLNELTGAVSDPEILNYIVMASGFLHVVLRFFTKDPITPSSGGPLRCLFPCLLVLCLVGCIVPEAVREKAILGEERSRRAVELLDQGGVTYADMEAFLRSEKELWAALRRAVE